VAINRTSKFSFVELHEKVARRTAADFSTTSSRTLQDATVKRYFYETLNS
jgi:hypothetical protein